MKLSALLALTLPLWGAEATLISNSAPYSAFTDLVHYRGRLFCVFREAPSHHLKDGPGTIRVMRADREGESWETAATLSMENTDLRDPKLSITESGELMLALGARSVAEPRIQSLAYFSQDGFEWSKPVPIGEPGFWLWRVTWHKGKAYSVAYESGRTGVLRLYESKDGRDFRVLVDDMRVPDYPNEATLLFRPDGTAYCFVRRDAGTMSAMLGESKPPYKNWTWKDMGRRVGSPHFIDVNGRMIGAVRYFDDEGKRSVSVVEVDPEAGVMKRLETLPSSNGDSGYAGLVWRKGELWISYYSTHVAKRTSIFVAKWRP